MDYIRSRKRAIARAVSATSPLALTAATATLAALMALPAHAQSADPPPRKLKNVVVTADDGRDPADHSYKADVSASPKATAALLDTPQTVTVIKQELFHQQAATTLTEALQNTPGVGTFYLGENGSTSTGDAVYLRGTDVSGSIFVDGIRDVGSVSRDVFNIEQVEVLKGAAGTDIGRGAATGAIDLVSKQPSLTNAQSASAGYGSGDYKRATVDSNFTIGRGAALRINMVGQDAGVVGRDRVQNNRWGVAPTLGFGLDGATRVYLDYLHVQQNNVPDGGVPTIGLPGYSSPDPTKRAFLSNAARVDSSNFYGTVNDHDDSRTNTATAIVEHDLASGVTLRNLTRWSRIDQRYQLTSFMAGPTQLLTPSAGDPSTWTITRNANNKDVANKLLTNQTNLRATFKTGAFDHTMSAGVEFIEEQQVTRTVGVLGALPAVNLYDPNPNVTTYGTYLTGAYAKGVTDTVGLYASDSVQFGPHWLLNGGVRLDHYRTKYSTFGATGGLTAAYSADGDLVSGKVGLVYKPRADASVYASYAVTKQPPGGGNFSLTATTTANAGNPDVDPQTAKTYEAGAKWDALDGALALSGAVYRTQYSDQILQDTDGAYYRAGAKRVQGIELAAIGQITPDWAINAGYTIMHTHTESPIGTVFTADGSAVLAYNPSSAFTLWSTYRLPMGVTVGGGAQYVGKMKRGSDSAIGTPDYVNSHWVLNAMTAYQVTPALQLQLNVYNLADERYVASINKSGYRYTPGAPRSARITANVTF